ncbi:MAG: hypothetical protein HWQ43_05335 [Nostoc sp. JL31]|uniref:hypothetical protein n=1 Tax=Nostoc sp. JL31 TaxID=2815395 RepID=UPI0025E959A5|nr:hypothetical protein [Nostoc sp. JL31]MBN3888605.1 hypothetical protein [Nostoc sp. JL31]
MSERRVIVNYIAIFSIKTGLFRRDRIPKYPISVLDFSTSQNRIAPVCYPL